MLHTEAQLPVGEDDEGEGFVKPTAESDQRAREENVSTHGTFGVGSMLQGEEGQGNPWRSQPKGPLGVLPIPKGDFRQSPHGGQI